jgi:hypothetical protein
MMRRMTPSKRDGSSRDRVRENLGLSAGGTDEQRTRQLVYTRERRESGSMSYSLLVGLIEVRGVVFGRGDIRILSVGRVLDVLGSVGRLEVVLLMAMVVDRSGLVVVGSRAGSGRAKVVVGETLSSSVEFPVNDRSDKGKSEGGSREAEG